MIARSTNVAGGQLIVVVTSELKLFAVFGSGWVASTLARSVKDWSQKNVLPEIWNVSSIVLEAPDASDAKLQSTNGLLSAHVTPLPLPERNVTNEEGRRSRTSIFVAVAEPLLVTTSS